MPISVGPAILAGAGIQGATSIAGGKKGSSAATKAAQLQYQGQMAALDQQRGIMQAIQAAAQPYVDYGTGGIGAASNAIGALTTPIDTSLPSFPTPAPFTFQPTEAQLEAFPGYQFTRDQALKAAQNQLTSTGLGRSMSAVDTASNVATQTALAASEQPMFNQALQGYSTNVNTGLQSYGVNVNSLLAGRTMDLQQRQQIANLFNQRLGVGLQGIGTATGAAVPLSAQMASAVTGGQTALASGGVGSANALNQGMQGASSAIGGATNQLANFALVNSLSGGGGFNYPNTGGLY